ncbi:hypothetical protein QAD02_013783 [Eretmocerus hayati]|uniref:Uncharacterized protein n=1 Tax=Eretmocerus hayati TaxID=131215 RepID=A0ACC2P577_9HYME|nr:hypothetical protein QAD02_013783 [Eretmocerus hayati]
MEDNGPDDYLPPYDIPTVVARVMTAAEAEGLSKYDVVNDNEIYIGLRRCIPQEFWQFLKTRRTWIFLKELLVMFWGNETLANRCVDGRRLKVKRLPGRQSPRKRLTPERYQLTISEFVSKSYHVLESLC